MTSMRRPAGVSADDWQLLLGLVEDYRAAAADPMGEANEAAQAVADQCVRVLLPDGDDSEGGA